MKQNLIDAIRATGITPPPYIKPSITRFSTSGKNNDKSGWVSVFPDGNGAAFGCWRTGEVHYWFEDGTSVTNEIEREEAIKKAKEERDFAYSNAAFNAQELYAKLPHALDHDYLTRKSVKSHSGLRLYDGKLVIPVYSAGDEIQSLQFIATDGTKRFYTGGKMQGGYYTIGEPTDAVLIAEGYATAMTLHESTNQCVVVAFNAGNIKPVYDMVRKHWQGRVIVCADNDASGIGIEKANQCTGADVVMPDIVGEDFNDMAMRVGINAVRDLVIGYKQTLFVSIDDMMAAMKPADWVIKNLLERGSNTLLFGESGACKSLIAMDWAFCIGNGIAWHGHKVKQGTVIVIAGEGHRGLAMRMQALKQKYNMPPRNIYFSTRSVNLLDKDAVLHVIGILDGLDLKEPPSAIFIDTMHRNMYGDENSSEDMAVFLGNMEILAKKYNAAIIPVHHSGHGDKGRARGSSAIKAGMDAEFCMTKKSKMEVTLSCTKSKDFNAGSNMDFMIKVVPLEGACFFDADENKQVEGVYLEYIGVNADQPKLKQAAQKCLEGLETALSAVGMDAKAYTLDENAKKVVTLEKWRPFAYEAIGGKSSKENCSRFSDGKNDLIKQGFVKNDGDFYWIP